MISVDPGKHHVAIAKWSGKTLVGAGLLVAPQSSFHRKLIWYQRQLTVELCFVPDERVVVEVPRIYPNKGKGKGTQNPEDILMLTLVAGACLTVSAECEMVRPSEWKGQQPKSVTKNRIDFTLDDTEKLILKAALKGIATGLQHNVLDAVGIGLDDLNRKPQLRG